MTNATFFIAETDANGWVNNPNRWEATKAKTLASAKRAASASIARLSPRLDKRR